MGCTNDQTSCCRSVTCDEIGAMRSIAILERRLLLLTELSGYDGWGLPVAPLVLKRFAFPKRLRRRGSFL